MDDMMERMENIHAFFDAETVKVQLNRIEKNLNQIERKVDKIMATEQQVKDALAAVEVNVAAETTVIASVEALLTNFAARIKDLENSAVSEGVSQDILDKITALGSAVEQNKTRLAGDVTNNTTANTVTANT